MYISIHTTLQNYAIFHDICIPTKANRVIEKNISHVISGEFDEEHAHLNILPTKIIFVQLT